jgi:hypothetical protein
MRTRWFLLGVIVGLALAPAAGRATWRMARDQLARAIDSALRPRASATSSSRRAY